MPPRTRDDRLIRRIAKRIRASLADKSMTPADLARAIRRQPSTVADVLHGRVCPSVALLQSIAVALDVTLDDLCSRSGNTKNG